MQLSDIPFHLLLSNVETMSFHAPSPACKCFTKEAGSFCRDLGCLESVLLKCHFFPGTCKDDSEREILSWKINYFTRNGTQAGDSELDW